MLGEPSACCCGGRPSPGTLGSPGAMCPGPEIIFLVVGLQYCEQATGLLHELIVRRVVNQLQPQQDQLL